jgi:hypothetical protein
MDQQLIITAFIMGLAGSLHCVGMCGPIAMALPLHVSGPVRKLTGALSYIIGRITTYSAYGLLLGLAGKSLFWFGWQQRLSIALGTVIILFLVIPRIFPRHSMHPVIMSLMIKVRQFMASYLFRNGYGSMYMTGLLNGLLPCGLVYMALAGAMVAGDPLKGMSFMMTFGLGTAPAMLSVTVFGIYMKQPVREYFRKAYPAILLVMAVLLILRGMNLGIPILSPSLNISASVPVDCHPG